MVKVFSAVVVLLLAAVASAVHTPDEWKSRTIYQLLTDRFATADGSSPTCDLHYYCGGKWAGITNHLDYIQGMGFDAIWISPVVANTANGYHGYWTQDFFKLNSNFGTEDDLLNMVKECHARDIWVMVDVVANHAGNVDYSQSNPYSGISPFNTPSYYHDCNGCPSDCNINDFGNQPQVEHCRLSGLPDLNQSDTYVSSQLKTFVSELMDTYDFDGLRIDTVPEVETDFWYGFQEAANAYAVGEVEDSRVSYVASYQGPLDSVLSYPMAYTVRGVFQYHNSMYNIQNEVQSYASNFKDVTILGMFIDNHDQTRFLYTNSDTYLYKNAITYAIMSVGIPIIYYGTEQGFNGGSDPYNREILWPSSYSTSTDLYTFIKTVVGVRKSQEIWNTTQVQRYADDTFYAFTRGEVFVALTNGGVNQASLSRTITYHPYSDGTVLCDIFWSGDCVTVTNGKFVVTLLHGECKIFLPQSK